MRERLGESFARQVRRHLGGPALILDLVFELESIQVARVEPEAAVRAEVARETGPLKRWQVCRGQAVEQSSQLALGTSKWKAPATWSGVCSRTPPAAKCSAPMLAARSSKRSCPSDVVAPRAWN